MRSQSEPPGRLEPAAGRPLYRQLLADLERRIAAGEFEADRRLPSEARIERSYGVSRITVRRALQELEQRGLIDRRQGRATRLHAPDRTRLAALQEDHVAGMPGFGLRTETELLEGGSRRAAPEVAGRLALQAGDPVHRSSRLHRIAGRPYCHSLTHLPAALAARVPCGEQEPLLLLLREGLRLGRVEQALVSMPATGGLGALLQVPQAAPLLLIERLFLDEADRPVALLTSHLPADRSRYSSPLGPRPRTRGDSSRARDAARVT